ncbi:acyl-CoA dehydrogenase [Panacagrimonas perspica]|uniref:Acyl-CoA dehydrogenase n=1 Tax=Panacagrimonas perspica TaxID=381431 RepID=A0A4S3K018_9GAMM|nr:acyl-CoA dehydrogenase [Panacagrimonas perspica]TDU28362.1 acyl-CoA dehydrogenase [Panacagrimonas perspica]THD01220.1 hypothetical protein B1810_20985 [Panacagrimonas perspica]
MSEQRQILADTADRLFADAVTSRRIEGFDAKLWQQTIEMGLPLLLAPEADGGAGGDWDDAGAVLHALGHHGVPIPLAENMIAAQLAADAGLELPSGPVSLATRVEGALQQAGTRFDGKLLGVPWGRHADAILAVVPGHTVLLRRTDATSLRHAHNLADEPRDDLIFDNAPAVCGPASDGTQASHLLALARCAQISGALEAALHKSVEYAQTRKQFGRAIGQFQAVQQQLAQFGAEVAAAMCATRAACRAATRGDASFQIAAAKLRCNLAIGFATSTAHQVHAAIGFTREFDLRQSTQRLWSWRTEGGNDRAWADVLGARVCARGDQFWADLTARDDAVSLT